METLSGRMKRGFVDVQRLPGFEPYPTTFVYNPETNNYDCRGEIPDKVVKRAGDLALEAA